MQLTSDQQQQLLDIARQAMKAHLRGQPLPPLPADPALHQPAGAFVSLHDLATHRLRGCVGRFDSNGPLAVTVQNMAASALEDPRFTHFPVTLGELPELSLEISVLSPLMPAADVMDFDLLTHGIYLTVAGRTGCFLPQVARETGWSKQQLLSRLASEKLGLHPDAWQQPDAQLRKFTSTVIGPVPF